MLTGIKFCNSAIVAGESLGPIMNKLLQESCKLIPLQANSENLCPPPLYVFFSEYISYHETTKCTRYIVSIDFGRKND